MRGGWLHRSTIQTPLSAENRVVLSRAVSPHVVLSEPRLVVPLEVQCGFGGGPRPGLTLGTRGPCLLTPGTNRFAAPLGLQPRGRVPAKLAAKIARRLPEPTEQGTRILVETIGLAI